MIENFQGVNLFERYRGANKPSPALDTAEERSPNNVTIRPYLQLLHERGVDMNWVKQWVEDGVPQYFEDSVIKVLSVFQKYQTTGVMPVMDATWSDREISLFEQLKYSNK